MTTAGPLSVGLRCNADQLTGVGHLLRCIALAEELDYRGVHVVFIGDFHNLHWADRQLTASGFAAVPIPAGPGPDAPDAPDALGDLALELGLSAVVLDGYDLDPASGLALHDRGVIVAALVDGPFGAAQRADLYLDQNLGATRPTQAPPSATVLLGLDYVLLRNVVRAARRLTPPPSAAVPEPPAGPAPPRVLAVFGGTDSNGAAAQIVPLVLASGQPMALPLSSLRPETANALRALPLAGGQTVHVIPPVDDLPSLVGGADLVVSAAGTSVWEMLCLGAPTAVVCVIDNQEVGYRAVVAERLVMALGRLRDLAADRSAREHLTRQVGTLIRDPSLRARLSASGWSRVDGRGRERVVDALLGLINHGAVSAAS